MNSQKILDSRYQLVRLVGSGTYADTWLATDCALGRPVAIKLFRNREFDDGEHGPQFQREIQSAAAVAHANVVRTFDAGHDGVQRFLVMEFVDGETLKDKIRDRRRFDTDEAVRISVECLSGLSAIHRLGIVHRDVKPQNVLVTLDGQVKLTDFGTASPARDSTASQAGTTVGTASYISPEQAQGLSVSPRSDIYSMGVVLYEMLTGCLPFSGSDPLQVLYQHVHETPRRPRRYNPSIPAALEAVILQALNKRPEDRFSSALEMQNALLQAGSHTSPMIEATGEHQSTILSVLGQRRSRIALTASSGVIAFVMLAASMALATRDHASPEEERAPETELATTADQNREVETSNSPSAAPGSANPGTDVSLEAIVTDNSENVRSHANDTEEVTEDEPAENEAGNSSENESPAPPDNSGNGNGNSGNGSPGSSGNAGNGNGNSGNSSPGNSGNAGNGNGNSGNGSPGNSGNAGNGNTNSGNGSPGNSGNAGNGNGNSGTGSPGNSGNAGNGNGNSGS